MNPKTSNESRQTLGNNVVPIKYSLFLEPDLQTFKTEGRITIECIVKNETRLIRLNSKETEIKKASVKADGKNQLAKVAKKEKLEQIELQLGSGVSGRIEIEIEFVCINNDKMYGFYRSKYNVEGKDKYLLTSQFEAANARTAFPCFDEPEFKATYCVSMQIDKNLETISNMPIKNERQATSGKKIVDFLETPKMSSYLLYLSVGEFEINESKLGKLVVRIISTPGKKEFIKLPMEYAKKSIIWLNDYFGIEYPLPKLDFIAIPDFAAGAMENWGAITFRETALLCNEQTALVNKQYIATVIAHEMVHQWFGDLVTMKWWNDLWLNESFAEFMAHKAINEIYPEWKIETQYVEETIGTAFSADSLKSTHPISVKVNTVGEIASIFDAISYQKGGSILYMLEDYVGPEIYRKGLHSYLKTHAYANATKNDLWEALSQAAQKEGKKIEVAKMVEDWITKKGHPMVRVNRIECGFSLKQERYTLLGEENETWPIPLRYLSTNGVSSATLDKKEQKLNDNGEWIKLNYGQKGFYRVKYDGGLLKDIGNLIKENKISDLDSWGVENDLFSFVRSARITIDEYLDFVMEYCMDKGYPTNSGISGHINWLWSMSYGESFEGKIRKANMEFHKKLLGKLGWIRKEEDDAIIVSLRSSAITSLGMAGDTETLKEAKKEFDAARYNAKEIDVNLRGAIYALKAWQGDKETFDYFVKRYKEEKVPDEQRRNLRALGNFRELSILNKTLELSNSGEVRLQDSFLLPAVISGNPIGRALIWDWTRNNWTAYMNKYDSGTHMLGRFVENLSFVSNEKIGAQIKEFFTDKKNRRDDMEMSLEHTLEKIETNIKFIRKNSD